MPFYKFEKNELFYNRIKTYPSLNFNIYDGVVIYNNNTQYVGDLSSTNILNVPAGNISLYELNVDRPSGNLIYPFITKEGSRTSFKTVSTTNYNNDFAYGDTITGSYPLSASLSFDRFGTNITGSSCGYFRDALKNSLNYNSVYSPAYLFSSSLGNKGTQELKIISIPSIFYGSSIKKGTCSLKFYVSGTLIGELTDDIRNGELRQSLSSSGADSGSVAGVVMYNEGFIVLTGSWDLDSSHTEDYGLAGNTNPRWIDFAYTGSVGTPYSSYDLSFSGTNYVPTMTMFAHAPKSQLNFSNNPTYLKFGQSGTINSPITSSAQYSENSSVSIKNIVKTNFTDPTGSFSKTTYISKVGIYDEYKNLIAIANLPTPIRKREIDEFTFKLKLDF
tara:strand:+ start:1737 stop:2903 length:1167 start_codon:yes stop_codon:yes gene_type:complete